MANFFTKIKNVFGNPQTSIMTNLTNTNLSLNSSLTMGIDELKKYYQEIYINDKTSDSARNSSILSYIEPIKESLIQNKVDNSKLYQIAPEIENAATILIPSILSPNNLSVIKGLDFIINNDEIRPSVKTDIIKILNNHFNNNLKLYERLTKWIKSALIDDGAKAILILPPHVIKNMKEEAVSVPATESLSDFIYNLVSKDSHDIFGKNNISYSVESLSDISNEIPNINTELYNAALEELNNTISEFNLNPLEKQKLTKSLNKYKDSFVSLEGLSALFKKLKEDNAFIVTSKINAIGANKTLSDRGIKKIEKEFDDLLSGKKSNIEYNKITSNDISYYLQSYYESEDDYPIIEELPYESVIPICIKNNPEKHIGYFVILDEEGCPLKIDINKTKNLDNYGSPEVDKLYRTLKANNSINNIFSSPRLNNTNFKEKVKKSVVNKVINSFIDITLRKALNNISLNSIDININNDIMSVMFSRLLKKQKTFCLFVPKNILFYLAFMHNDDGTGKSKIENIKFPLSLKMTFMITKLIGLIDASINRKQIEVELDEENSINHLEILRAIKNRLIQNRLTGFSYDPSKIIQSIAEKEVSIIPKNLPGVNNFSITENEKSSSYPRPDDALFEEINNMYILGLDVPPSVLNQLGENEFSRSVATYNFFFSNKIINYQNTIINFLSNLIIAYVKYSKVLKEQIANILKSSYGDNDEDDKDKSPNDIKYSEELLYKIISDIRITLPPPKIVHDKAHYEEIDSYIDIANKIVSEIFPDDLIGDRDYEDTYRAIKAYAKVVLLKKYLADLNVNSEFEIDELENIDIEEMISTKQIVMNINKALNDIKTKLSSEEEESSPY